MDTYGTPKPAGCKWRGVAISQHEFRVDSGPKFRLYIMLAFFLSLHLVSIGEHYNVAERRLCSLFFGSTQFLVDHPG